MFDNSELVTEQLTDEDSRALWSCVRRSSSECKARRVRTTAHPEGLARAGEAVRREKGTRLPPDSEGRYVVTFDTAKQEQ
jgi:hypothetical protein